MAKTGRKPKGVSAPPYSSKIIKAGALLADTKTLLAHWDVAASAREEHRPASAGKRVWQGIPVQG